MEMAVRSMEMAETVMETDGDGSGGTSPSAETETSVPQNLSPGALFRPEALYRRRGVVRGLPGAPPT
jgi:hypothetical protein